MSDYEWADTIGPQPPSAGDQIRAAYVDAALAAIHPCTCPQTVDESNYWYRLAAAAVEAVLRVQAGVVMTDLRQQLEAELTKYWLSTWVTRKDPDEQQVLVEQAEDYAAQAVWDFFPLIKSAIAAARQETAQRIEASVLRCKFGGETDLARSAILATVMDAIRAALARETGEQQ